MYQIVKDAVVPLAYMEWGQMGKDIGLYLFSFGKKAVYFFPNAVLVTAEMPEQIKRAFTETASLNAESKDRLWKDFCRYFKDDMVKGLKKTAKNYFTGTPEDSGEAAFDVFMMAYSLKGATPPVKGNFVAKASKFSIDQLPVKQIIDNGRAIAEASSNKLVIEGVIAEANTIKNKAVGKITNYDKYIEQIKKTLAKYNQELSIKDRSTIRYHQRIINEAKEKIAQADQTVADMNVINNYIRHGIEIELLNMSVTYADAVNDDELAEGGHMLDAEINIQIIGDESVAPNRYRYICDAESTVIHINPRDLHLFEQAILQEDSRTRLISPATEEPRDIKEVVPAIKRTSRGL